MQRKRKDPKTQKNEKDQEVESIADWCSRSMQTNAAPQTRQNHSKHRVKSRDPAPEDHLLFQASTDTLPYALLELGGVLAP